MQCTVHLKRPHPQQERFLRSPAVRKVIRAGRRGGKTTGLAIHAVEEFLKGERVLYAVPTADQILRFWHEVCLALTEPIEAGLFKKNETLHIIELPGTEQRIRAKTAWSADTLRGDYCTRLILDEWQLCDEAAWELVGAPMMLDRAGSTATFCYTPPSLHSKSVTKATDPRHAAKLFKYAQTDTTGRWETFHFTSHDNPHISKAALADIIGDMTTLAYEQEILAEDKDEAPGALWNHAMIDALRVRSAPELCRVVVGVDPPGGETEAGIVVMGKGVDGHGYVLADYSLQGSPNVWAAAAVKAYQDHKADRLLGEKNYGGDMVENTIRNVKDGNRVSYKDVVATRGKAVRAEPIAALYERGMIHHVGAFPQLEDEMCNWVSGDPKSPNRLDAMVWAATELDIVTTVNVAYETVSRREAVYPGRGAY